MVGSPYEGGVGEEKRTHGVSDYVRGSRGVFLNVSHVCIFRTRLEKLQDKAKSGLETWEEMRVRKKLERYLCAASVHPHE